MAIIPWRKITFSKVQSYAGYQLPQHANAYAPTPIYLSPPFIIVVFRWNTIYGEANKKMKRIIISLGESMLQNFV